MQVDLTPAAVQQHADELNAKLEVELGLHVPRLQAALKEEHEETHRRDARLKAAMADRARAAESRAETSDKRLKRAVDAEDSVTSLNAEVDHLHEQLDEMQPIYKERLALIEESHRCRHTSCRPIKAYGRRSSRILHHQGRCRPR